MLLPSKYPYMIYLLSPLPLLLCLMRRTVPNISTKQNNSHCAFTFFCLLSVKRLSPLRYAMFAQQGSSIRIRHEYSALPPGSSIFCRICPITLSFPFIVKYKVLRGCFSRRAAPSAFLLVLVCVVIHCPLYGHPAHSPSTLLQRRAFCPCLSPVSPRYSNSLPLGQMYVSSFLFVPKGFNTPPFRAGY